MGEPATTEGNKDHISLLAHGEGNNHLIPGMSLDLGELELRVVGVHLSDLFLGGCPQDLDDLDQLIHSTVPWEDGLTQQELCKHTPCTPDI